ncbi:MAG: MFS transporter [Candidatus Pacebacteria bacterium]|nr:MFS transporter [Candidatus Paceibacterota bacterium]
MNEDYKKKLLTIVYVATTFYAMHNFIIYFVFSNYLSQYFSKFELSLVYTLAAFTSVLISNFFGDLLKKFTNYKTLMFVLITQTIITLTLVFSSSINLYFLAAFSIMHIIFSTLIWVSINVFVGEFSDHENIGSIRGTVLTLYNLQAIIAPFVAAQFFEIIGYPGIFILSTVSLLPLIYLTKKFFSHVKEPKYKHVDLFSSFRLVWKNKDIRGVVASSFALNSFYATINIYLVLYLTKTLGIPTLLYIGIITPISVIPFILIPYKLGKYSDEIFGEKKAMIFGILLMSLTLLSIAIFKITTTNIMIWAMILFIARLGATIAETENYAYFYKKIDARNAGLVALFQNMVNIGFLFISLLGAILIGLLDMKIYYLFLITGIIGIISIFIIIKIRDTERKKKMIEEINNNVSNSLKKEEEEKEMKAEREWKESIN